MELAYACTGQPYSFVHAFCTIGKRILVHHVTFGAKSALCSRNCCRPSCGDCLEEDPDTEAAKLVRRECNGKLVCFPRAHQIHMIGCNGTKHGSFMTVLYECVTNTRLDPSTSRGSVRDYVCGTTVPTVPTVPTVSTVPPKSSTGHKVTLSGASNTTVLRHTVTSTPTMMKSRDYNTTDTIHPAPNASGNGITKEILAVSNTDVLVGSLTGATLVVAALITLALGLFCCRNRSPCKTLGSKIKCKEHREEKQRRKREAILSALGYDTASIHSVTRQNSLASDKSRTLLCSRPTYDGLTAINKFRTLNNNANRFTASSSCTSCTTSSESVSDLSASGSSCSCIDRPNKSASHSSYRTNFSPLYNRSLTYIEHNKYEMSPMKTKHVTSQTKMTRPVTSSRARRVMKKRSTPMKNRSAPSSQVSTSATSSTSLDYSASATYPYAWSLSHRTSDYATVHGY